MKRNLLWAFALTTAQVSTAMIPLTTHAQVSSPSLTELGKEDGTFTVPANTKVRYGVTDKYLEKIVSGTFKANNAFFGGDPAYGIQKTVWKVSTPAAQETGTYLGLEFESFTVAANSRVRYGLVDKYIDKTVSGKFTADNAFFGGDPAPGIRKSVWLLSAGTTPAPVPPTPVPPTPPAPPTVTPSASCGGSGSLTFEKWNSVSGTEIQNVPVSQAPSMVNAINSFEISNLGDNYATRISGYICAPYTGNYTFYISGDDAAELYLSDSTSKSNKERIAFYNGWTNLREITKYPEQKSTKIPLEAGKKYYVEVLHKEGGGGDSVSVGWDMPNGVRELPLGSNRILPATVVPPTTPPPTTPTPPTTPPTTVSYAEPSNYSGPIVITKGGTYTGNWKTSSMNTPAVDVKTSEPVIILNSHIAGPGTLIAARYVNANLTVRNNYFHGKDPIEDNVESGRGIAAPSYKNLVIENNFFENTSTVIATDNYNGNGTPQETLKVRFNRVKNIDGRHRNGTGRTLVNFVGVQNYDSSAGNPKFGEISWNEVINKPNESSSEDLINFYNAGGRADSWFKVHNNYLEGSFPNPASNSFSTGSAMQIDGPDNYKTAYIEAFDNQIVATTNCGLCMAAGSNTRYYRNRIISSGQFADGSRVAGSFAGAAIFYYYSNAVGPRVNQTIEDNVIGWANPSYTVPFAGRQDYSTNLNGGIRNNTHLPNPITLETEAAELPRFRQKVQAAGVKIGPQ